MGRRVSKEELLNILIKAKPDTDIETLRRWVDEWVGDCVAKDGKIICSMNERPLGVVRVPKSLSWVLDVMDCYYAGGCFGGFGMIERGDVVELSGSGCYCHTGWSWTCELDLGRI